MTFAKCFAPLEIYALGVGTVHLNLATSLNIFKIFHTWIKFICTKKLWKLYCVVVYESELGLHMIKYSVTRTDKFKIILCL